MATEVWFRNPDNFIRELVEVGEHKIAWDRGILVKKRIDPVAHARLYFGATTPYRVLLVGAQGTAELRPGDTLLKPHAVYPSWEYGESSALLEDMLENPPGKDLAACFDASVPPDERPVYGQENRVLILNTPVASSGPGRKFLRYLKELQEDHPDSIIHVHGLYSWRYAFGMGLGAADIDPRVTAQKGKVCLPAGSEVPYERAQANPKWVTSLGFKPADLAVPRNRCMYNIKSAVWAGKNYDELLKFRTRSVPGFRPDIFTPNADYRPPEVGQMVVPKGGEGDKFLCDTCSLQGNCSYFRAGAVCSLPNAEPKELAAFFNTRDSGHIIDGLGTLVAANARRLDRGMRIELDDGELDPEVTKILGQVFDQGTKLAKLIDPNLRGGAKVQVNVGAGGAAAISAGNPRQLIAAAIRELEDQGIRRDEITPDMIKGMFEGMQNPARKQQAIEGTVIHKQDERAS